MTCLRSVHFFFSVFFFFLFIRISNFGAESELFYFFWKCELENVLNMYLSYLLLHFNKSTYMLPANTDVCSQGNIYVDVTRTLIKEQ